MRLVCLCIKPESQKYSTALFTYFMENGFFSLRLWRKCDVTRRSVYPFRRLSESQAQGHASISAAGISVCPHRHVRHAAADQQRRHQALWARLVLSESRPPCRPTRATHLEAAPAGRPAYNCSNSIRNILGGRLRLIVCCVSVSRGPAQTSRVYKRKPRAIRIDSSSHVTSR